MHKNFLVTSGYSPVNGINMYYEIHGSGNPLVMVHGGGSTIQSSFGRLIPELAKTRQIIAMELQAHGRTDDRNQPVSFEQDAADVAALLRNLNIAKADFMGFSNGGNTVMRLAMNYPDIVNKLIIMSSFFKRTGLIPGFFEGLGASTFSDMPMLLKASFLQVNSDERLLKLMFEKDKERMTGFKDWNESEIMSINAPALIIIGDTDVVMAEHAVEMSRLLPHSRLTIIPGRHGEYIGEITTLTNGKWSQCFLVSLYQQFLDS